MRTVFDDLMQREQLKVDKLLDEVLFDVFLEEPFRIVPIEEERKIIKRMKIKVYHNTKKYKLSKQLIDSKRAELEKNVIRNYSKKDWMEKLKKTNGICPKCKDDVGIIGLTLDHIFPLSKAKKGRIYTINDIQPLCKSCNSKKSNDLDAFDPDDIIEEVKGGGKNEPTKENR